MTALDFPNSPTLGQTFAPGGSALSYMWDGARWRIAGGLGSPSGAVGYAQITNNIPLATTQVDVVSVTFTAVAGRRYRLIGKCFTTVGGGGQSVAHIRTSAGAMVGQDVTQSASASGNTLMPIAVVDAAASGSVTYKLTIIQAANGNLWADATDPAFLLVEDITYQPGSGGGTVSPPTPWIAATLIAPWVAYDANNTLWYRKVGDIVYLRGLVKGGTTGAITTMPADCRPATGPGISGANNFPCIGGGAFAAVNCTASTGALACVIGSGTSYLYVDGVQWSTTL